MTADEVKAFRDCVAAGGVALFPSDTVYGLAAAPERESAVRRLYEIKGRSPERPAAVMFFDLERALATLGWLGPPTRAAIKRLLPGPLTLVVPNPGHRYPLACGPSPERLGVRVPLLTGALQPLGGLEMPVLQSSANRSGGVEAHRLEEVDRRVRAGVDLEFDAGELPGTPSTVVDLSAYDEGRRYEVLREGAVPTARLAAEL